MGVSLKILLKRTVRISCFTLIVASLLFGAYHFAVGQSAITKKKNINVVTIYLSDIALADSIAMEDAIGHGQVAPYLKSHGYNVENILSMHRIAAVNGGLKGALSATFDKDLEKDNARMLVITVTAQPGGEPYTVLTQFALADMNVSGIIEARRKAAAAQIDQIWHYEGKPMTTPSIETANVFHGQLDQALHLYNQQFKLRSTNY